MVRASRPAGGVDAARLDRRCLSELLSCHDLVVAIAEVFCVLVDVQATKRQRHDVIDDCRQFGAPFLEATPAKAVGPA